MMRLSGMRVVWGALGLLVVFTASAGSQRAETVVYTGFDARPYLQLFKPLLGDPKMRFDSGDEAPVLQSQRVESGAYAAVMVRFDVHRSGPAMMDAPLVATDRLPGGSDDIAMLMTCGEANGGGGYVATVETRYRRHPKGWEPEAFRYQQVKDCAAAMQAYAKQ